MKPKTHEHPKPVKYPEPKEPVLPVTPFELRVDLAESIFASAAGAYIRDVAHRPSVPEIEFEKMARMAIQAAKVFRKVQGEK